MILIFSLLMILICISERLNLNCGYLCVTIIVRLIEPTLFAESVSRIRSNDFEYVIEG